VVVAHAIVEAGLKPVFVDSNPLTLNMDWAYVEKAMNEKTLSVISTSLFGNPVAKSDIRSFREKYPKVNVIQDCAHSFFADNIQREGLVAIYGMNVSKLMTTIFGGMASTDDDELAQWLTKYQEDKLDFPGWVDRIRKSLYFLGSLVAFSPFVYWFTSALIRIGVLGRFVDYYDTETISLPDDAYVQVGLIETRLGVRQLKRFPAEIERRRILARLYGEALSGEPRLRVIDYGLNATYSHYVVVSDDAVRIREQMLKRGVELGKIVDYDISSFPSYRGAKYFGGGASKSFPQAVLNLPIHRGVSTRKSLIVARKFLRSVRR
jgi:dTDP-4-amino-4,6-dideoxygalactose transaminase